MGIKINFTKAQEITKERLRVERKPLLGDLDVAFLQAIEVGSDTKEIVRKKQELRDVTTLVDTARTLDELKQIKLETK